MAGRRLEGRGVLDVGCGSGWLLAELAARGIDEEGLHGVDMIPSRVKGARDRLPAADIRRADARALPYDDDSFDLVAMLTCLSSMGRQSVDAALREAARVVAPAGIVLCYEPQVPNPFNRETSRIRLRDLERTLGPAVHVRRLTGFPPVARRLGRLSPYLYPSLSRLAPTHALTAHAGSAAPTTRG